MKTGSDAMARAILRSAEVAIAELQQKYHQAQRQQQMNSARSELANLGLTGYAKGGYVSRPTPAMIGEGGEPEYVIPQSRMGSALANFAAGRRGNSVLNPQVNITTGPVQQIGGQQYVSKSDLMSATSSAAKQGAEMALGMLQSDPRVRRSVGLVR